MGTKKDAMRKTKVGRAILNAFDRQVDREVDDKSLMKTYAKVSCKREDYDDFINNLEHLQVWKSKSFSEKNLRSPDFLGTLWVYGRRFYFIVKDDAKRITVTWR